MPEDDDRDLLARAVKTDADALSTLLERYGPQVEQGLRIARSWSSVLEPSDVMQVTYLDAFLQIERFDPTRSEPFSAWLSRIAENNLRDAIRGLERQKRPQPTNRVQPRSSEDGTAELYALLGTTTTTPSRKIRREEADTLLQAAMDALPDDYAHVIRLYDLEGRDIDSVATVLERSAGAVHMLRARAHNRLREILGSVSFYF